MAKEEEAPKQGSRREAWFAAKRRLSEMYPDDYRKLLTEEFARRGMELEPTAEERAERQIVQLLRKHPALRDRFPRVGEGVGDSETDVAE